MSLQRTVPSSTATSRRFWPRPSSRCSTSGARFAGPCQADSGPSNMATILIVEDNAANMKLAVFLLQNAGYAVLSAPDAETGLTLARAARPDLILMDIQLPGMD